MGTRAPTLEDLWRECRAGGQPGPRERLVERFMPLLEVTAERVRWEMGGKADPADLLQAGTVGLLEALERYDPERGVSLVSFCAWRIAGAMHEDQQRFDWLPRSMRAKGRRLKAAADELRNSLGRKPFDEELARAVDAPVAEVARLRIHTAERGPVSIEAAPRPGSRSPGALLEDNRSDPVSRLVAEEARALLLDAILTLPDKQRYTLLLYYFERLRMSQIGLVLGVSESRVSRLRKEALRALAECLGPRKDELLDLLGT